MPSSGPGHPLLPPVAGSRDPEPQVGLGWVEHGLTMLNGSKDLSKEQVLGAQTSGCFGVSTTHRSALHRNGAPKWNVGQSVRTG